MLLQIRARSARDDQAGEPARDAVDSLLDCHARIRGFHAMALRLGEVERAAEAEIGDAASRIERYFTVALPLHVEDEERSLLPRLLGLDPSLDQAVFAMRDEHRAIEAGLARVVELCALFTRSPSLHAERRRELLEAAHALDEHWDRHLGGEEALIFPAMRARLSPDEMAAIAGEMRDRRRDGEAATAFDSIAPRGEGTLTRE